MNSKLRAELNLLFDDGRIAHANDKPPHVQVAYIDRAEKAIRQAVGEEMLELVKSEPTWERSTMIDAESLIEKIKQWQGGEDE